MNKVQLCKHNKIILPEGIFTEVVVPVEGAGLLGGLGHVEDVVVNAKGAICG